MAIEEVDEPDIETPNDAEKNTRGEYRDYSLPRLPQCRAPSWLPSTSRVFSMRLRIARRKRSESAWCEISSSVAMSSNWASRGMS